MLSSTAQKAPHYVLFSTPLLTRPSQAHTPPSSADSLRFSFNLTEFHTHTNRNNYSSVQLQLYIFLDSKLEECRSQWPRGQRRRSAAPLGLWVRIPPGAWTFVVSVVCCQVEVSAMSRSLVQRSPTDCGALLCVI